MSALEKKRMELKMKMNEARKLNNAAVKNENEIIADPNAQKRDLKKEYWEQKQAKLAQLKEAGLSEDKGYLYE